MTFVTQIKNLLSDGKLTRQQADAIAKSEGITDKTVQKELTELAIVLTARDIALQQTPLSERFQQIVGLYKRQVNLSHRTSQSIMLQQYSTPAPISFMAGEYVKHGLKNYQILEPSAGNGLLTIAFPTRYVWVNEIDELRHKNLSTQDYIQAMRVDATADFTIAQPFFKNMFEGIVTNPPFGTMDNPLVIGEYKINHLDHVMCIRALDCMKDNGRAAMIIGGHTNYDAKGRVQAGKNRIFLTYLYSHYNVEDIINIDGSLYSRQGTSFNVRLILINGRKAKPEGYPPLKNDDATPITDFESLYERVTGLFGESENTSPERHSTSFHSVNEGDYVEIYTGINDKRKIAEGKVAFKYGKHYLKLDNDNETKYNYGYTYFVVEPTTEKTKRLRIAKAKAKALILIQSQMTTIGNIFDFGEVFTQFKGKPKQAIKHLIKVKQGEAVSALYRDDIGFIDIVWGENDPKTNKGFGLKHIIEKHGREIEQLGFKVEDFIPIVIQFGEFNINESTVNKKVYESRMFRFVIRTSWNGKKKQWLLSAFDLRKKPKHYT